MTTYILHGGAAGRDSEQNRKFFATAKEYIPKDGTMLVICHAREKELWNEKFELVQKTFLEDTIPKKKISLVLASEDTIIFEAQVKNADVLYILGGDTCKLRDFLRGIQNFEKLLENKVVVGSSAGALVFAKYFYSNDYRECFDGLGFLPLKMFCHYSEGNEDALTKLQLFKEEVKVIALQEEEYLIIEK